MGQDTNKLFDRVSRQSEEALGRLAEELAASPMVGGAVAHALGARERAVQAQEAAMGMLNIPSAADIERLTRRMRSVSQRLESIEDTLDRLEERLAAPAVPPAPKAPKAKPVPKRKAAPKPRAAKPAKSKRS